MGEISDMMSALPDDILITIISRLTLREATATSIISHRWRYLHTYVTHINFPPFTISESELGSSFNNDLLIESFERRFGNHVKMIDGVLDSHRGGVGVKELKMHMHKMKGASVEKWLEFALTKVNIEVIDISLQVGPPWGPSYSLGLSKFIDGTRQIQSLKQLSLDGIDMNDQDFDLLFSNSNFVALESVSIRGMRDLKKISIVGHPKLKHVDIRFFCTGSLKSLEIRDVMNLLSLGLYNLSDECAVELENIPKLTKFYYGEHGRMSIANEELFVRMPSCILDQLQLLYISVLDQSGSTLWHVPFKFVNIKHMELEVKHVKEPTIFYRLEPIIRACPSLQKLKINFDWWFPWLYDVVDSMERKANVYYPPYLKTLQLSPNLKELEMEGYLGSESEFELASYIINYAANLEQVIVLPCDATKDIQREATARAKSHFQNIAPPRLLVQFK